MKVEIAPYVMSWVSYLQNITRKTEMKSRFCKRLKLTSITSFKEDF